MNPSYIARRMAETRYDLERADKLAKACIARVRRANDRMLELERQLEALKQEKQNDN